MIFKWKYLIGGDKWFSSLRILMKNGTELLEEKDLPTGTYIYKIKIITYDENQKSIRSGTISLVR